MYSCTLCAQTLDWKIDRRKLTYRVGILAMIFTIFLVYQQNFANTLDAWLSGMVNWVAPWAAVMLIHYWIFTRQRIDVDALFEPPGRGPLADVRWSVIVAFAAGILATWLFSYGAVPLIQGPAARAIGGVDLSWLAGAVVAGLVCYLTGAKSAREPAPVATPSLKAS
jgi:toxin CptA